MGDHHRSELAEVPTAVTEAWRQWLGQTVDEEFPLREYLGGSAHAAVFLTDRGREEPERAAIKLIAETASAERQIESWRLASALSHPNLLRIFGFGRCQIADAKLLYVVMELADEDLSQILPERALTESEATEMLEPALAALAYLHRNRLLHGGVKPSNILAHREQLKLSADGLRTGGSIIEPGSYDPPEAAFSAAGDVWSLGMTLVEILTQRLPAWDRKGQADPDLPESLPPSLLDIARHCLQRDPRRRWTIPEIANRLQPGSAPPAPSPAASRPALPARRSMQPAQSHASPAKSRYWILALLLLLALTGLVSRKSSHSSQPARVGSPEAESLPEESKKTSPPMETAGAPQAAQQSTTPAAGSTEGSIEEQSSGSEQALPPAGATPSPSVSETRSSSVAQQVMPDVPQKARSTIRGTVRVSIRVSIDPLGNVTSAVIDSRGPSPYFANLALEAAQQWKFAPGDSASSEWIIHFDFLADGTNASARPAS